jgi:hypothetical protein
MKMTITQLMTLMLFAANVFQHAGYAWYIVVAPLAFDLCFALLGSTLGKPKQIREIR